MATSCTAAVAVGAESVTNMASAARLGVKQIPLYQIHFPDIIQPFKAFGLERRRTRSTGRAGPREEPRCQRRVCGARRRACVLAVLCVLTSRAALRAPPATTVQR